MGKSHVASSATEDLKLKNAEKCHEDVKSDTKNIKVVLNETVGFMTVNENPVLALARAESWYLMTRCSVHVCNNRDMFVEYHPMNGHEVILDFGSRADVLGIGKVKLQLTSGKVLTLTNVFHMPGIRKCCASVGKLTEMGLNLVFANKKAVIKKGDQIVGGGYMEGGLYRLAAVTYVDEESNTRTRDWYLNSRTKMHMCNSRDMYLDYHPVTGQNVIMDDDVRADVVGMGTVMVRLTTGKILTLVDVLHVPTMNKCVVSVGKLDDNGFDLSFGGGEVVIRKDLEIFGKGYKEHGLYRLSTMEGPVGQA